MESNAKENLRIAESIATALKGNILDQTHSWYFVIAIDGLMRIGLRIGGYGNEGKIQVMPSYPTYVDDSGNRRTINQHSFDLDCKYNDPVFTGIRVSMKKTPEQIAKDIERRFLGAYQPLYAKALAYCQEQKAYYSQTALVTAEVKQVFKGLKNVYVKSISPRNINLDCSFSPSRAVLVAEFLKNLGDE